MLHAWVLTPNIHYKMLQVTRSFPLNHCHTSWISRIYTAIGDIEPPEAAMEERKKKKKTFCGVNGERGSLILIPHPDHSHITNINHQYMTNISPIWFREKESRSMTVTTRQLRDTFGVQSCCVRLAAGISAGSESAFVGSPVLLGAVLQDLRVHLGPDSGPSEITWACR